MKKQCFCILAAVLPAGMLQSVRQTVTDQRITYLIETNPEGYDWLVQ